MTGKCGVNALPFQTVARRVWVVDQTLKVWDVTTGEYVATLQGHRMPRYWRPLYFCDDLA